MTVRTTVGTAVAPVVAAVTFGCGPHSDSTTPAVPLALVASTEVPLSHSESIALVREGTACVDDSFEFQVHCVTRNGRVVGVFGREGEGPGEFRSLWVARGPDGHVVVIDPTLSRLTIFRLDGAVVSETSLPAVFLGLNLVDDRIVGSRPDRSAETDRNDQYSVLTRHVPMELSALTGEMLWSRTGMTNAASSDCLMLGEVGMSSAGGLVVRDCASPGGLAFFEDRDGEGTVVRSPGYIEEFPNERDVDAYVSGLARLGGGSGSVPASLREAWSAGFRDKPKGWYRGPFKFDGQGHTWIATNRDRDAWSFIEVWAGSNYLRTVVVRDRLISYDLLGKTLVVLVERSPGPDGIAKLAMDWYEMPDWATQ